jgi:hypothetical protein
LQSWLPVIATILAIAKPWFDLPKSEKIAEKWVPHHRDWFEHAPPSDIVSHRRRMTLVMCDVTLALASVNSTSTQ